MKITRIGKVWGAAHIEAEPIEISHDEVSFQVYVTEKQQLCIELPPGFSNIIYGSDGLTITIQD